ncbi:hypothetical protein ANN_14813 [Periplaneta americana]|uniref:GIY-YIG domain-containing protein n=1 Tax=Periplaneta americana TaxID=6978 RepID=A0ABQ8SYS9_PERAM|nr:hypothetical protein ANN_14813 [Periplaneta americana]
MLLLLLLQDESHFIKSSESARSKAASVLLKSSKRVLMLSGTPALSRPIELYPQISAINPRLFSNVVKFGKRYCAGVKDQFGWNFSGSSNLEELKLLLEDSVMIRRLKSDVIPELPPKVRDYISDILDSDKKFICFAHHKVVLDGICDTLMEKNKEYATAYAHRLSSTGVYRIPCSCRAVYIGTTQQSFKTRISEHRRNCRLGHVGKSAVAEHAYLEGEHNIRFEDTNTLSDTPHLYARLHREAIEIYKHKNNFNRKEEGLKVNKAWYPALRKTNIKPAHVAQLNNTTPDADRVGNSKPAREAHSSADRGDNSKPPPPHCIDNDAASADCNRHAQ